MVNIPKVNVRFFRQLVQPGWSILDIGANMGAHTIALARLVGPTGKVLSFEPQRIIFQALCANVALNDREDRSAELIKTIDALGYSMYWHTPLLFNSKNFYGNATNIFGSIVSKNMLCIHRSIDQNIDCPAVVVPQ